MVLPYRQRQHGLQLLDLFGVFVYKILLLAVNRKPFLVAANFRR